MNNTLAVYYEIYTCGLNGAILNLLGLMAIFSGILVIYCKNSIMAVLWLIFLVLDIACYYFYTGLTFIGLCYMLVYVGAISILFLFILMLINVRTSELRSNTSNSTTLAIMLCFYIYCTVLGVLPVDITTPFMDIYSYLTSIHYLGGFLEDTMSFIMKVASISLGKLADGQLYFVTSKAWDGSLSEVSHIGTIGNILYTMKSIWLLLTSTILLLAMVGIIAITINPLENSGSLYNEGSNAYRGAKRLARHVYTAKA